MPEDLLMKSEILKKLSQVKIVKSVKLDKISKPKKKILINYSMKIKLPEKN